MPGRWNFVHGRRTTGKRPPTEAASWLIVALGKLLQNLLKHLERVALTTRRSFVISAHSLKCPLDEAAAHAVQLTVLQRQKKLDPLIHVYLLLLDEETIHSSMSKRIREGLMPYGDPRHAPKQATLIFKLGH